MPSGDGGVSQELIYPAWRSAIARGWVCFCTFLPPRGRQLVHVRLYTWGDHAWQPVDLRTSTPPLYSASWVQSSTVARSSLEPRPPTMGS